VVSDTRPAPTDRRARQLRDAALLVSRVVGWPVRSLIQLWRVSLQARVVISTLALGAVVLSLTAFLLLDQIGEGLVDSKRHTSLAQARAGFADAQAQLDAAPEPRAGTGQLLDGLLHSLESASGTPHAYEVLVAPVSDSSSSLGAGRASDSLDLGSVPDALLDDVRDEPGAWWTYTRLQYEDERASRPDVAAIVVGSQVEVPGTDDDYALFYLFPLDEQQRALGLVGRAVLTAGVILMALVAGIAWLVTRQVVTPVRLARRIAERLAAGRLEERMQVRGDDDIARLGRSFNQMATSLQRQIRQLEELSRLQRRFVSDVSHELRTPLTTVRMAADVLHDARGEFDGATARSAELLQGELDRFEALLAELLEISRFDAGAAVLDVQRIDLVEVAEQVCVRLGPLAERAGIVMTVRSGPRPTSVDADPRRIERIVRNLVSNAIAHAQTDRIELLVAGDDDAVALAVRDHGVGLRAGEAAMVFQRFWRADPARARTGGGTGLGLAIAMEDALLHGGWLQAWGEPGNGSQFRLTLPRLAAHDLRRSPLPLVPDDLAGVVGAPYGRVAEPPATVGGPDLPRTR
jgi:two-component system, OmpR family, sensor histidine kinase MtrB